MHRDISEHGTYIFSRDASIEIRFGCHAADTSFECLHTTSPPKADGVKLGSSEEIVAWTIVVIAIICPTVSNLKGVDMLHPKF